MIVIIKNRTVHIALSHIHEIIDIAQFDNLGEFCTLQ